MKNLINGVQIEELLGREPIKIEVAQIADLHSDKVVLVTGGAGSIGSELVREICAFSPKKIVIIDQGETALHYLILELKNSFPNLDIDFILADISDKKRMQEIFLQYSFDIVYHAAAYKHVPIVEENPQEGVRVNIFGTKNIAELSAQNDVERFVMISTDKAVNPASVMGATKRIAELIVQSLQQKSGNKTKFIITRFGNVLGSNGSVVLRFKEQIEQRGPITITHSDATRYFMSMSEACKLVLLASNVGNGGEICVFDMGEPIRILDLAEKMCQLYGLEIGKDIDLVFTGLRSGDKITEELFEKEYNIITHLSDKIMIFKDKEEYQGIENRIASLPNCSSKQEIITVLENILPNFKR